MRRRKPSWKNIPIVRYLFVAIHRWQQKNTHNGMEIAASNLKEGRATVLLTFSSTILGCNGAKLSSSLKDTPRLASRQRYRDKQKYT